jgi:ParB family transcriptional regulator, chromosome partitioning protein
MTSNSRPVDAQRIVTRDIPVERIRDHPENYNYHPAAQVERLALSHNELGQYRSIVVWQQRDGTFMRVAGHGYSEGAQRAGATMLRCEVLPADTPASTVKAIMLADNLHATGSEPDDQALVRLLEEQRDAGFSLEAIGSSDASLAALLAKLESPSFEPVGEDEQGRLDEKAKVICPECGCTFEPG